MTALETGEIRLDIHAEAAEKIKSPGTVSLTEEYEELKKLREAILAIEDERTTPIDVSKRRAYTTQAKSLDEFYELMMKVLQAANIIDGTEYSLSFTKEYPPVDAKLPAISAKLLRRSPWSFRGRQELMPRVMEDLPDPQYPGNTLQILLRRQINEVELICWAKTAKEMGRLAEWVEDKFYEYLWVLQWCGEAHPITWIGRGEDIYREDRMQPMYGAPLRFSVVTGKISYKRSTILRRFATIIGVGSSI